jgi:hypothetical protein
MGSNVKVGRVGRHDLLNATVWKRPEVVHAPAKMGRWVNLGKYRCDSDAIHAKCGRTRKSDRGLSLVRREKDGPDDGQTDTLRR